MADRADHSVACEDVFGRSRLVVVGVVGRRVSLIAPPGEAALMSWTAAEELRRLLAFAVTLVLTDATTGTE
jgi:hypothetical protein